MFFSLPGWCICGFYNFDILYLWTLWCPVFGFMETSFHDVWFCSWVEFQLYWILELLSCLVQDMPLWMSWLSLIYWLWICMLGLSLMTCWFVGIGIPDFSNWCFISYLEVCISALLVLAISNVWLLGCTFRELAFPYLHFVLLEDCCGSFGISWEVQGVQN